MKIKPFPQNKSDTALEYLVPTGVSNKTNYFIGLVFLVLNKIRNDFQGYSSTRGFSSSLFEQAVAHDLRVVGRWHDYLKKYDATDEPFKGKKILELGPGSDLGVGLFLLAEDAETYSAMDIHNLIEATPPEIYEHLFDRLKQSGIAEERIKELKNQLQLTSNNQNDRLDYRVTKDFDLSVFNENHFDLVVSNTAFNQFHDPAKSIAEVSKLMKPGAKFIALIDLKTLTRFINARDPLNIYRYRDSIYNRFRFTGTPNRIRSYEYERALKDNGWANITIFPRIQLPDEYVQKVNHTLNKRFRDSKNQMQNLTVVICATKV